MRSVRAERYRASKRWMGVCGVAAGVSCRGKIPHRSNRPIERMGLTYHTPAICQLLQLRVKGTGNGGGIVMRGIQLVGIEARWPVIARVMGSALSV